MDTRVGMSAQYGGPGGGIGQQDLRVGRGKRFIDVDRDRQRVIGKQRARGGI